VLDDEGMPDSEFNIMAGKVDEDTIDILDSSIAWFHMGNNKKCMADGVVSFLYSWKHDKLWVANGVLSLDDTTLALISFLDE
jgi:hypothetical protein